MIKRAIHKIHSIFLMRKSRRELLRLKDSQKGKRCFIIGNGPSLQAEDLTRLRDEFCFAANRIYKVYDKTVWRPRFYCAQDPIILNQSHQEMSALDGLKLIVTNSSRKTGLVKGALYTRMRDLDYYPDLPTFSEDIPSFVGEGFTVTYTCLQVAAYMGFKEIYLLGCDHNYPVQQRADGTLYETGAKTGHFYDDNGEKKYPIAQYDKQNLAFEKTKIYCENAGIAVFNATRGGKLEIFPRVDFDQIDGLQ